MPVARPSPRRRPASPHPTFPSVGGRSTLPPHPLSSRGPWQSARAFGRGQLAVSPSPSYSTGEGSSGGGGRMAREGFAVAVHALVLLAHSPELATSAFLAGSVNTHATCLRRVLTTLAREGLVEPHEGLMAAIAWRVRPPRSPWPTFTMPSSASPCSAPIRPRPIRAARSAWRWDPLSLSSRPTPRPDSRRRWPTRPWPMSLPRSAASSDNSRRGPTEPGP